MVGLKQDIGFQTKFYFYASGGTDVKIGLPYNTYVCFTDNSHLRSDLRPVPGVIFTKDF